MKFKAEIKYRDRDEEPWWETYDEPKVTDEGMAKDFIFKTVGWFNETLRPKEPARQWTGKIEVLGDGRAKDHDWTKVSIVTQASHLGSFDKMRCSVCGCEGRRYGLGQAGIKRSPQYKAKKWATCPGAQP